MMGRLLFILTAIAFISAACRAKHSATDSSAAELREVHGSAIRNNDSLSAWLNINEQLVVELPEIEIINPATGQTVRLSGERLIKSRDGNMILTAERKSGSDSLSAKVMTATHEGRKATEGKAGSGSLTIIVTIIAVVIATFLAARVRKILAG